MIIALEVSESDGPYSIGTIVPPTDVAEGARAADEGPQVFLEHALAILWADWHKEVPEPDDDSQFIDWLREQGWTFPTVEVFTISL